MFGGEDIGEIDIFYQWQGAYTKEQMSDEVLKVEQYLDAHRKEWGIQQVYSRYSEQGWARTWLELDTKDPKRSNEITEKIREGLPKSALAKIGIGGPGGQGGGGMDADKIEVRLVGDSCPLPLKRSGTNPPLHPTAAQRQPQQHSTPPGEPQNE